MSSTPESIEGQQLLAALDAELADASRQSGRDLQWSAAESQILFMLGEAVDRKVELSALYRKGGIRPAEKVRLATEIRLSEQAISRLLRQVSTEVAVPMSITSQNASKASRARWDRVRMQQAARGVGSA
jgi:hypothetical protein